MAVVGLIVGIGGIALLGAGLAWVVWRDRPKS